MTLENNQSKKSILLVAGIGDRATKKLEFIGDLEASIKGFIQCILFVLWSNAIYFRKMLA